MMKFIFLDIEPDDLDIAIRAAKWLHGEFTKDAILVYGAGKYERTFYVRRNKASISVLKNRKLVILKASLAF